jgi:putative ABC transport system permease protein
MLQNYFTIAWRSLWKNKVFSLINIFGLSIGIGFTLLIGAYVWGELQVNQNLKNADNQYIIQSKWKDPNMGFGIGTIAGLPKALKENYPRLVANFYHWDGVTSNVSVGTKHFRESMQIGDSTFLSMYGFKLLHGDVKTAFNDPFSVVVTEKLATKYFGSTDVIGKALTIQSFKGGKHLFTITGVLKKPVQNSVTTLDNNNRNDIFLTVRAAVFLGRFMDGWVNTEIIGFVELQKGVTPKDLEQPIRQLMKEHCTPQLNANLKPYLDPLKTFYQHDDTIKRTIYTLSLIALFILLMAIVNFINICIGRSSSRMKEMGIRKVLGGLRKQLIIQFLTESVLLVLIATGFALIIYVLARPYFSDVLGKEITGLFSFPVCFYGLPFLFAFFIGVLAGVYPALVLSSLKSVDSLKGKLNSIKESVLFRKVLVAFQFGTAAFVLISAIIISQQIDLFFNKDLGFKKDYVVYAQVPRDWSAAGVQKMEAMRYQVSQLPQVSSVALSWEIPDGANGGPSMIYKQGTDPKQALATQGLMTDNQYALTYNIPLKAGTYFSPVFTPADSSKIVINETASNALGYKTPADAVGQLVNIPGVNTPFTICGVTRDFHFGTLAETIKPLSVLNVNYTTLYRFFSIKLKTGNVQRSIAALQSKWSTLFPDAPFEYHFMDEALAKLYQTEIQLKKAAYMASILTIVIVLLGILGLVSLSIQKRTKEIGIRKVLGSSVPGIISLFIKEFLSVVVIAALVACPLAWMSMHSWLKAYAYRITISGFPFMIAIALLTLLTVLLISIQTIKAALNNPVKSLRTE